ncbi:rab GTPase-activating protein 1-like [Esox lucius]|uniref:RAB GTPase activating protein 1-like 2 n=1 Tax=Esox lucius TaxID=8010 RepID=A0AAY5KZ71_ESOLU|nr:rab GTPase-activating protein 1-like [Esox lucius]
MMQEVSIAVAYDAHIVDQMTEEILACLVTESSSQHMVSNGMEKQPQQLCDPIDRYQTENLQLQQASLRLEQENDVLAHRLVTSKISLRAALDQAEDRADELTKELLITRKKLKDTVEEKRRKEEETVQLKDAFRGELDRTESEVKRSSGIISDYKQICSQLTLRIERQQAAHREELQHLRNAVSGCSRCQQALGSGVTEAGELDRWEDLEKEPDLQIAATSQPDQEKLCLSLRVTELEKELAQTKLQMVEAKCKIQELEHQKRALQNDLHTAQDSWLNKTLSSIRSARGGRQISSRPRDRSSTLGGSLHGLPLSAWSSKRLSWGPREAREESSDSEAGECRARKEMD